MRSVHRSLDWVAAHPIVIDGAAALVAWPLVTVVLAAETPNAAWLAPLWGAAYVAPLAWRRTHADRAAVALVVTHLVQLVVLGTPTLGNFVVPVILYSVAAFGDRRWSEMWLAVGLVGSLLAGLRWSSLFGTRSDRPFEVALSVAIVLTMCGAIVVASWGLGALARSRRASAEAWRERAQALERERYQGILLSESQARQQIAREMHDIVAHSLSVIVIQADGGAYLAGLDGDPEKRLASAAQALETIKTTARSALGETRRLVGVLREDDSGAERAPSETLADVPALVARLTDAGRAASLEVVGDPVSHPPLTPGAELALYRIVQESLTNVIKHAGPGAAASVTIAHSPTGLTVTVRDDGRGAGPSDGQGHGMVGMRERMAAYGGTLATHNLPRGGFEVVAHLPAPDAKELP